MVNWDLIHLPIKLGGLGVGDVLMKSVALLSSGEGFPITTICCGRRSFALAIIYL